MTWKMYDYECGACGEVFESLEQAGEYPDHCEECGAPSAQLLRCATAARLLSTIIPAYPGAKRRKAGYVHTHGDRPAEKGTSQVSMSSAGQRKWR